LRGGSTFKARDRQEKKKKLTGVDTMTGAHLVGITLLSLKKKIRDGRIGKRPSHQEWEKAEEEESPGQKRTAMRIRFYAFWGKKGEQIGPYF